MILVQRLEKPSAVKPQKIAKMTSTGTLVAKPNRRKLLRAAPRQEMKTTDLIGRRSLSQP
jgi:hypothetical protein